jgi:hypothetical protein
MQSRSVWGVGCASCGSPRFVVAFAASDLATRISFRLFFEVKPQHGTGSQLCCCSTVATPMKPCLHSAMSKTLVCIIGASGVLLAASEPESPETLDQSQGGMDWCFWIVLASLVVMTGRQLTQDVLALRAWMFPATPVTPEAVPSVAAPDVPAASIIVERTAASENSMSGPVEPDVASSSTGSVPCALCRSSSVAMARSITTETSAAG